MTILSHRKHTVTLTHEGKTVTYTHAGVGFEYLEELLCHPHQPISPTHLRQLFQIDPNAENKDDFTNVEKVTIPYCGNFPFLPPELPIEAADPRAIKEVRQALLDLIEEEEEAARYHDLARLEDIRAEKAFYVDYLLKAQTPMRKPRYLRNQPRNDYSAVKQAIKRAIEHLAADFPDLTADLNAHLDYGLLICYHKDAD